MKKQTKVWSALLMIVLASSLAMAAEKTAAPQPEPVQLEIGAQDVITASDAGGGYMSTRDIIIVVVVIFAVIGLIAVL